MANAIDFLIQGYQKFKAEYFEGTNAVFNETLRYGQQPKILVIACSDSRVDPALVTNCQPGDLFVVRNVANLVPPYEADNSYHGTSAALEFGVCGLGVQHIIVFGHTQCGGITSLFTEPSNTPQSPGGFIAKWMELAQSACQTVKERHSGTALQEQVTLCGQYSLIQSLKNLQTFPWIKERVAKGELNLHAWNFDLSSGTIRCFDPAHNEFVELKDLPEAGTTQ
jgi:Carbonic anhydrase